MTHILNNVGWIMLAFGIAGSTIQLLRGVFKREFDVNSVIALFTFSLVGVILASIR